MEIKAENLRIGLGTDLHRLEPNGRTLKLGGIAVQHPAGCGPVSHSDGDVVLHAVIDAILGAAGLGDIGTHFPDNDPSLMDVSSVELLRSTLAIAEKVSIINIDITIHCEQPKIGPYRKAMQESIASVIGIDPSRIGIKGKTFERIPFPEGIEAIYVTAALLCHIGNEI